MAALHELDGPAHLSVLYETTRQIRERAGLPLSASYQATIRRTVQQSRHIVQDESGSGVWRLVQPDEVEVEA